MNGTIRRIINTEGKRYGFIQGEDGIDRFFHPSGLQPISMQFDQLREGMAVQFTHQDGAKGPRAYDILAK